MRGGMILIVDCFVRFRCVGDREMKDIGGRGEVVQLDQVLCGFPLLD